MNSQTKTLAQAIINHTGDQLTYSECKELLGAVAGLSSGNGYDMYLEFNGAEYRLIDEDSIWEIYVEGIKEITQDCYLDGRELEWWIAIDWEATAKICMADGYGHHFSGYDGSQSALNGYYVFRTN